MTVGWQKIRVPLLERLALLDLAERRGQTEEEALSRIIREAVKRECVKLAEADAHPTEREEVTQA